MLDKPAARSAHSPTACLAALDPHGCVSPTDWPGRMANIQRDRPRGEFRSDAA
jgi:hypothetical protein